MSVYTRLSRDQLIELLARYELGELRHFAGIAEGIENSNYLVVTSHGRLILTVFERLGFDQLPFYLQLMSHLNRHQVSCPEVQYDRQGECLQVLFGKPAALVSFVPGAWVERPTPSHISAIGHWLGAMHQAVADFSEHIDNPRGPSWHQDTAAQVQPFISHEQQQLLHQALALHQQQPLAQLPSGAIHGDLFRNNAHFEQLQLSGVIDFYFAAIGSFVYDLAVVANDWCLQADGQLDAAGVEALLSGYQQQRALNAAEQQAWPQALALAALRFWLSRLHDLHLPRAGDMVHAHDPAWFERLLRLRLRGC